VNVCKEHDFGEVRGFELGFGPLGPRPPWMNVFFYVLEDLVIDTAQRHMQRAFLEIVKGRKIAQGVLTHHHEDHSGNAAAAIRALGIPIHAHPLTVKAMREGFGILPYQHYVWGRAERAQLLELPDVIETEHCRLRPVHTPGHSEDHTVFIEEERGWLFTGDLFLAPRIKFFRYDENMRDTIESLKKVLRFDFDSLFCAHNPQPKFGKKKLKKKLEFLENLQGEVARLLERGYDEKRIVKTLNKNETSLLRIITFGTVSFAHMVRSAIADIRREHAPASGEAAHR